MMCTRSDQRLRSPQLTFITRVMCLAVLAFGWSTTAGAAPPATMDRVTISATVTAVKGSVVTIARGSSEGLSVGSAITISPMRSLKATSSASVDVTVVLAKGKVTAVTERTAEVTLEVTVDPVKPGDVARYPLEVPAHLTESPLFQLAQNGIFIRSLESNDPFFSLATLIENDTPEWRDKVIDQMVTEVRSRAELAKQVMKVPITAGRYHGKALSTAFEQTNRKDINDFLGFIVEFPGKYFAKRWKLVDIYATWLINGCPTGRDSRLTRELAPRYRKARQLAAAGKLTEAETELRAILDVHAEHEDATEMLGKLRRIGLLARQLSQDPGNTTVRWERAIKLYELMAFDPARQELDVLEKAGYKPFLVTKYRAYILFREKKYAMAIAVFEKLLEQQEDANISRWIRSARARMQLESGDQFAANLELAAIAITEEAFDSAQGYYRRALDAAKNPKQIQQVRDGQKRVQLHEAFEKAKGLMRTRIEEHSPELAIEQLEWLIVVGTELGLPKALDKALDNAESTALSVAEHGIGFEINRRRLDLDPKNADAVLDTAWLHYVTRDYDACIAAARTGRKLDPKSDFGFHVEAKALLAKGDLAGAEKLAKEAARDKGYGWPRHALAAVYAGRGDWKTANTWVEAAHKLLPNEGLVQAALSAVKQALIAEKDIAAGKDVDRARLTLVRSLSTLDQWRRAVKVIESIETPELQSAGWWTIAKDVGAHIPTTVKLDAVKKVTDSRPRVAARRVFLEAELAYQTQKPPTAAQATAYGRALVKTASYDEAWVVTNPFADQHMPAADVIEDAKRGQRAQELIDEGQAREREGAGTAARRAPLYRKARALFDRIGNVTGATLAAFYEATTLSELGKKDEALSMLETLLPKVQAHGTETDVLNIQQALADIRFERGVLNARLDSARNAVAVCRAANNDYCLSHNYLRLAGYLADEGQLTNAIAATDAAKVAATRLGFGGLIRRVIFNQADMRYVAFKHAEARDLGELLLRVSQKSEDSGHERLAYMVLGAVAMRTGKVEQANDYFERAYDLGARTGDNWTRGNARRFQGNTWLRVAHEPAKAVDAYSSAAAIYKGLDSELREVEMVALLGVAQGELGQFDKARKALDRAYTMAKQRERTVFLALVTTEQARLELSADKAADALPRAREAAQLADKIDLPGFRWTAWHALGRSLEKTGDLDAAVDAYDKAVAEVIKLQPRNADDNFLNYGRTREVYKDAIDLMLRKGKVKRALEILEVSRDANLRRMFDPKKVKTASGQVNETLDQLGDAEQTAEAARRELAEERKKPEDEQNAKRIEALSERVAQSDANVKRLLLRLKARHSGLYNAFAVDPRSLLADRDLLPKDAVVLTYFAADDSLFIFVISRAMKDAHAVKVDLKGESLNDTVARYRRGLERGAESADELSRQLYDWLLRPVEKELEGMKTVLIMPSGPLYYLPYHALITNGEDADKPHYAIEKYRMAYLSSTTVQELRRPPRRTQVTSLTAFANPDGTLPGAVREIDSVKETAFPEADVLYGENAKKDAVFEKAGKFHIMHFATHGVLDADPLNSHLTMSTGKLTVDDIAGIDFAGTTDLIVLSACRTALAVGEQMGEGISIAEAFATAGAPSLVASLWDVDDEATSLLMRQFYSGLSKHKSEADLLDALRTAQLALINLERDGDRPFASPVYWAAFELIGDYR